MPTPTIQLTGDAVQGITVSGLHRAAVAQLPMTVALGRKRHRVTPQALKMAAFWDPNRMTVAPPSSINRRDKAALALARMYRNDVQGCCVISGKAHLLGLVSGNDQDSGGIILATDAEIDEQYVGICGPGDQGCYITEVLNVMKAKGFKAGGKYYKIDGYVSVDHTDKVKSQVSQIVFGANSIGINLPRDWTQKARWSLPTTASGAQIVGGHDVTPIDYDEEGVYVSSWGRIYLMEWAAWMSKKYVDEYYAILAQSWYNNDQLAPNGFDVARLRAALATLGGGGIPDIDVTPPPPPPPPPPPSGSFPARTMNGAWTGPEGEQVSFTASFSEGAASASSVSASASRRK
jgi:hypothetical protein